MPAAGLCGCAEIELIAQDLLTYFTPFLEDEEELVREGYGCLYWASGISINHGSLHQRMYNFTPLRQTIVLFMAAVNNEL